MEQPTEVEQLLEELREEGPRTTALVNGRGSKMVVLIVEGKEVKNRYEFGGPDAALLLSSQDAIDRLFSALDYPGESFVELHGITVDTQVIEQLEKYASTVDEI